LRLKPTNYGLNFELNKRRLISLHANQQVGLQLPGGQQLAGVNGPGAGRSLLISGYGN
jgi:hypothetical protein